MQFQYFAEFGRKGDSGAGPACKEKKIDEGFKGRGRENHGGREPHAGEGSNRSVRLATQEGRSRKKREIKVRERGEGKKAGGKRTQTVCPGKQFLLHS